MKWHRVTCINVEGLNQRDSPDNSPELGERVTSLTGTEARGIDCPLVPYPACFMFSGRPQKDK
jgi:hypothetical protein